MKNEIEHPKWSVTKGLVWLLVAFSTAMMCLALYAGHESDRYRDAWLDAVRNQQSSSAWCSAVHVRHSNKPCEHDETTLEIGGYSVGWNGEGGSGNFWYCGKLKGLGEP